MGGAVMGGYCDEAKHELPGTLLSQVSRFTETSV